MPAGDRSDGGVLVERRLRDRELRIVLLVLHPRLQHAILRFRIHEIADRKDRRATKGVALGRESVAEGLKHYVGEPLAVLQVDLLRVSEHVLDYHDVREERDLPDLTLLGLELRKLLFWFGPTRDSSYSGQGDRGEHHRKAAAIEQDDHVSLLEYLCQTGSLSHHGRQRWQATHQSASAWNLRHEARATVVKWLPARGAGFQAVASPVAASSAARSFRA